MIAIEYIKRMFNEKEMGRARAKLPRNKTNTILKIVERLLALKNRADNGEYTLFQTKILQVLSNQWGGSSSNYRAAPQ